jgi:hypothetical protein
VVGDQIGGHTELLADLARRRIPDPERVHNRQPGRVAEGGVHPSSRFNRILVNFH